jgi:tetratricopeptide (TPR) repeat protein
MALRLSERAASGKSKGWAELNTLGSVLYRAGRYPEALQRLNQAIDAHKKRATAWDDLLLAMVHQHLGHSDQAKQHLDQAQHSIASGNPRNSGLPAVKATPWDERAELKLLSAEAEALLKAH